jgi:hypothetical protein
LFAGEQILIKAVDDRQVKVSRFRPGKETEHLVCSNQVVDIVRTIVQLGGGYPDAIMALQAARQKDYLACRIELEALPGEDASRQSARALVSGDRPEAGPLDLENPIPDMFRDSLVAHREQVTEEGFSEDVDPPTDEAANEKGFVARMTSWWTD